MDTKRTFPPLTTWFVRRLVINHKYAEYNSAIWLDSVGIQMMLPIRVFGQVRIGRIYVTMALIKKHLIDQQ